MAQINVCITTAEHVLLDEKYDLYLGDWAIKSPDDFDKTLPNPISTQKELEDASDVVDDSLSRVLESLANYMNASFKTNLSVRFWKIYITPFLLHWMTTTYFRYLALGKLKAKMEGSNDQLVFNFIKNEEDFKLDNSEEFLREIIYLNSYSHVNFQKLIRYVFKDRYQVKHELHAPYTYRPTAPKIVTFRDQVREVLSFNGYYFLGNIKGLNILDKFIITGLNFGQLVKSFFIKHKTTVGWDKVPAASSANLSTNLQDWGFEPKNEFDKIMADLVISALPKNVYEEIPQQPFLKQVKYWVGNASNIYQDELAYIGRVVENGGKWFSAQHGGVYGHALKNGISNIEYLLTDHFLTWGWTQSPPYNVKPIILPSPILSKLKNKKKSPSDKILYIGTAGNYIPIRIGSTLRAISLSDYKNFQYNFIDNLSSSVKKALLFRDHPLVPNPTHKFYKILKDNNIEFCKTAASKAALEARVVVVDHCSTSFLETMVMDIPTVIFWNEAVCKLNSVAREEFLKLKEVGIWHETEVDAALFLNENFNTLEDWWNSPRVQEAKNNFLHLYGRTSNNIAPEWAKFLRNLSKY